MNGNCVGESDTKDVLSKADADILFVAERPDIIMIKGKGMYLWDSDGKKYLDFIGGWAVTNLGHCPKVISEVLFKQSKTLINASPAFYNEPMIRFAGLLKQVTCFDRVFFTSTGAEANESAIKLARKYGSKFLNGAHEIITVKGGFHGRTLATMSATGKESWKTLFHPKVEGFKHVPLNDIKELHAAVTPNTCAIMLEPVQGEGGVYAADDEYIKAIRKLCDDKGILLIFDEIQTGLGRTGKLFSYEHYGIEPDIMTLAKGLGGGYPISAMLTKEKFNIFEPGDQGGTYTGQPLGMAVGYAVLNEIIKGNYVQNAANQGEYLINKLNEIKDGFQLSNIRGKGLLIGFDLPSDHTKEVVNECLKDGLIINSPKPSIIRLIPPLIVSRKDIDKMVTILSKVLVRLGY